MSEAQLQEFYRNHMRNPKRVESFEEREKIKDQRFEIGDHYVCGCGSHLWILATNGDCICAKCLRSQARIIVNELAPVTKRAEGKESKHDQ
jgi:sulfur transfer protein SufE